MKSRLIAFVLASAVLTETSLAQSLADRFDRLDRDGNGQITAEELPRPELLRRLDRNGDGVVTRNEAPGARNSRPRSAGTGDLIMPDEPAHTPHLNLPYDAIDGVDPNLLSLDLYVPEEKEAEGKRPVMIMIHGGGWRGGDKASPVIVGAKMRHFVSRGYLYASINYRLSPEQPTEGGLKHPVHAQDCAKAIAWIHDHIADYGGDPDQLHLMGHSAGGHLAAIVGTNERFLEAESKDLSILQTNVLLDPAAIDIPGYLASVEGRGMTALYQLAFGTEETNWLDASPQQHVGPGKNIPPTLLFYGGERMALDQFAPTFAESLTAAGSPSLAVDTVTLDHGQINSHIGMIDEPMTALIMRLHAGEDVSILPPTLARKPADREPIPIAFSADYRAGSRDTSGRFLGGTEIMRLVAFDGKLYAGNGYWTDQPGDDPRPGAQILVKRGPDLSWEVSRNFPRAVRISAMEPVTFQTDQEGANLASPVSLLLADAGLITARDQGPLFCHVLAGQEEEWAESRISESAPRAFSRAFGAHRDAETGIDHVFAGTGAGEIYRGSYDPDAPGQIRWSAEPEYANPDFDGGPYRRCQGFCVANGKLYASVSPRLLVRIDGPSPQWEEVFRWDPEERAGAGLRGITALPGPEGRQVILGSREQEGRILQIDPGNDYAVTDELFSQTFLRESLGREFRGGKLVAYNRFIPGPHPKTGAPVHWVTVAGYLGGDARAAWLLLRHPDATYETVRVFDQTLGAEHPTLVSTRTLAFSPWSDRDFYTGGYDGAANDRKNHNTAWIFKGTFPSAPST